MWFPVLFRFLAPRSLTFGRWGCGERCHLSHAVGDSAVVLSGMSRQIALQTRSSSQTHEAGFKCPSGHGRREKRLQSVSGGQARRYPSQGLSGRQEPRQPPAKPICTVQAATRLVGGRRPSVLQRWGSGGLPDGFRLRSRRCRNRGGSVVLEIGEQKHARDFEAAKRAMQDRQSTRNCMQCSVDCPPAAGSLNPAALNDTKAVFECLFVVGYGAFPTKLFIQPVCF